MKKFRINENYFEDMGDEVVEKNMNLESYFSTILNNMSIYTENDAVRKEFDDYLSLPNAVFFFVGYRQTGKTIFLKKYFNIQYNTPFFDEEHHRFILPIMGKGDVETKEPYDKAVASIKGLCDLFEQKYNDEGDAILGHGVEDFFQYILHTHASWLPELTFSEASKLDRLKRAEKRIDKMQLLHKLNFYVSLLNFYFVKYGSGMEDLVILLDDIYNIYSDMDQQRALVETLLDVFESMRDDGRRIFLIISARPYTYRGLKEYDRIMSYAEKKVWNDNKLNSARLFQDVVSKAAEEKKSLRLDSDMVSSDAPGFGSALFELSQKFGCKYATMIEKLCFYDTNLIMQAYKRILLNKTWVREGKFRFNELNKSGTDGLTFTNITCIRALACGNKKVYQRWKDINDKKEIDKLIPNILFNEEDKDYRMLNLYTMKYYLRNFSDAMEQGGKYLIPKDYINIFHDLLGFGLDDCIFSTNYLFETEILRRSVADVQKTAGTPYDRVEAALDGDKNEGIKKQQEPIGSENKLYITSRGTELWDMFRGDSVLLELCREDMYLFDEAREDSKKPSYELMMEAKQQDLFLELLKIIRELSEQEFTCYQNAFRNGKKDLYQSMFGKRPITLVLLEGVAKSIQYSGCRTVLKYKNELEVDILAKWKECGA